MSITAITSYLNNGYSYSNNNYKSITNFPSSITPRTLPVDNYRTDYNNNIYSYATPDSINSGSVINAIANPNSSLNIASDYVSASYSPFLAYTQKAQHQNNSANLNFEVASSQDVTNGYMSSYQNYQNQSIASTISNQSSYADHNSSNYDSSLMTVKPTQPLPSLSNGPYFNVDPYNLEVSTYADPTSTNYDPNLTNPKDPASPLYNITA